MVQRLIFAFALLVGASGAFAQPTPPPQPTSLPAGLSCADFTHNADGSWTPNHVVSVTSNSGGGIRIAPPARLRPGSYEAGVDLAALLTRLCSPR